MEEREGRKERDLVEEWEERDMKKHKLDKRRGFEGVDTLNRSKKKEVLVIRK